MTPPGKETLLHKIRRLYTELFLSNLHARIERFHPAHPGQAGHDIGHMLHDLIDGIVEDASHQYSAHDYRKKTLLAQAHESDVAAATSPPLVRTAPSVLSMTGNGLSMYLQKHHVSENEGSMSERLQQCVWDHIHSAHRFARMADAHSARLHADIASNAMKTLLHYLSEAQYTAFYNEVCSQMEQLRPPAASH